MLFMFKGKHLKEAAEARRCWLMSISVDLALNILSREEESHLWSSVAHKVANVTFEELFYL